MTSIIEFPWQQEAIIRHSQRLMSSFQHWTGDCLLNINASSPQEKAQVLFEAPFVLVSHGIESNPIFNYGNRKALELWELSWEEFITMPSRKSAEEVVQEERDRLLAEAATKGFISNYSGIRISGNGKRFYIEDTILWNVVDEQNQHCGQAAFFSKWKFIT
ncbi:MEKHLA domain-containing protein [Komarekiella sp. 'clone 1']|uniref:MEKHLA domain-containing protein n=1 Tax=Komarekiella delphini-convector SJRDD-AB1 TaxID=2593771 RepID=A0AA40VTN6_9NOST|nr:MEKHLA domain-containing protein [Komarekiella delphini-convector]MBD6618676.1 MEKHLA domain-containing protein [Komarekiella delphini-convector SJRDD-AB1]